MPHLPLFLRDGRRRSRNLLAIIAAGSVAAAVAFATPVAADSKKIEPEACVLAGIQVPNGQDQDCPKDVLSTLRAYYFEYEAPKIDAEGNPVLDGETGEVVMEVRKETFSLMADFLEAGGFGDALKSNPGTVFALPDSVLRPVLEALREAVKDEAMRGEIMGKIAAAAGAHALNEPISKAFRNANGKVWGLAGGWQTDAPPLTFYALSGDGSVRVNGVMLERTLTAPDGSVIHTISAPLVALPRFAMEMAHKSS